MLNTKWFAINLKIKTSHISPTFRGDSEIQKKYIITLWDTELKGQEMKYRLTFKNTASSGSEEN